MKRKLMTVAAVFTAVMFMVASCDKPEPDNNGGLVDDTEQNGNQDDNQNNNENENQNNNQNNNENDNQNNNGNGEPADYSASLQGSEYVTIALDEYSTASIQDKIKASYLLDDTNVFLYIWEGTYNAGTPSGLNFYGEAAGWSSLVVGNVGWSGCGYCVTNPEFVPAFVESAEDLSKWYFHIGYKGAANIAQCIILYWQGGEYKFAVGQGAFEDSGVKYQAIAPTSGEFQPNVWNEYEVCLTETGFNYAADNTVSKANLVAVLSGGVPGTTLDMDAIFFYKK